MSEEWELAQRKSISAFRVDRYVLIVAEGELPTPGFDVDIVQDPRKIFPPQFDLLRRRRPGIFPAVITPYRYAETVLFPPDRPVVTVHHADGSDEVTIAECPTELAQYQRAIVGHPDRPCPPGSVQATGFSANRSFDEAFANAVAALPPFEGPPDALDRVEVLEVGGLFGGFAGFNHLFVRVCRVA
jgi:hypothetical protein